VLADSTRGSAHARSRLEMAAETDQRVFDGGLRRLRGEIAPIYGWFHRRLPHARPAGR
jgi:hypothetical protein